MLSTVLIVLLILLVIGALPTWPYSRGWGYHYSGGKEGLEMKKFILLILTIGVFIVPYPGFASERGSSVVYGADGTVYQYGYTIINFAEPICKDLGCYNLCEGSNGCMTLQYGDAPYGCKAPSCPSYINSGCSCNSCHKSRDCTRD
jgi:hypothetical protein